MLGGILGYAIGALLYDTIGQWLINLYGYGSTGWRRSSRPTRNGDALVILVKGADPDPLQAGHDRERPARL